MNNNLTEILCDLQGSIFTEAFVNKVDSKKFIETFLASDICKAIDEGNSKYITSNPGYLFDKVYGNKLSNRVSVIYSKDAMYWLGYMYRYISIKCNKSSLEVMNLLPVKNMKDNFTKYNLKNKEIVISKILS